jgi:hypothetical protein
MKSTRKPYLNNLNNIVQQIDAFQSQRLLPIFIVLISLLINIATLARLGNKHGGDTIMYLEGASNLISGLALEGRQAFSITYILLVAASRTIGLGEVGVLAAQIGLAMLAALATFDMGKQLAGNLGGIISASSLIFNLDIGRWNAYVLTDSLYISLVVLTTWSVHRVITKGGKQYLIAALLVIMTAFLRHNGWFLLPITISFWIYYSPIKTTFKWFSVILITLVFLGCTFLIGSYLKYNSMTPETWLRQGTIIWSYDKLTFPMPQDSGGVNQSVGNTFRYGLNHPLASIGLALTRIGVELLHVRPFYSVSHNLIILTFVPIIYIFGGLGFWRWRKKPLIQLASVIIAVQLMIIGLTFADWDGRYLLYVFPLISLVAACEASVRMKGLLAIHIQSS